MVKLHYSISSIDDVVFESTFDKEPIDIKIGSGIIPQKLEMTLYGLSNNSEQTITLKASDAFGERHNNKIKKLSKSSFPNKEMIKKDNIIEIDIKENDGKQATTFAMIKEVHEDEVLLDLNHPLAGIDIKFKVKILRVYE